MDTNRPGSTYNISSVVLKWEAAYAVAYQIQVSDNGSTWSNIYSTTTGDGGTDNLTGLSGTGRYVRMHGTQRAVINGQSYGFSLYEFEINGSPVSSPANVALGKPASASSVEGTSFAAGNGNDGNLTSRWSSAYSAPQWIQIDLGSTYTISSVVLKWEAAYAVAYQIQVSDNGSAWSSIYSTTTGDGGTDNLSGLSGAGRYIRMYGTQRAVINGQSYGFSLYEFEVFGTQAGGGNGEFNLSGYTLHRNYDFGTDAANAVKNITDLSANFNPYMIAGTTVINNEWQRYQPFNTTNHAFTNTDLALTAVPNLGGIYDGGISSGQIATKETFNPQGTNRTWVFQVRAKIPKKQGAWPAFWLYAKAAPNTPSEIDIFEFFDSPTQNTYDWTGYDHGAGIGANYYNIMTNQWVWHPGFDFSVDYHTYTLVWKEGDIQKWVDGTQVKGTYFTWFGSDPQVIINLATGGGANNNPAPSTFPCQYMVDYFRVYYKDGSAARSASATGNTKLPADELMQINNDDNIYPNPATSMVNIAVTADFLNGDIVIFNVAGTNVIKKRIAGKTALVNVSGLPAGTYFVRIQKNGKIINRKLVVSK